MKNKEENLKMLLTLIDDISNKPENAWFKIALASKYSNINPQHPSQIESLIQNKINLIETYLAVNFDNIIDYSEYDEPAKEQLFRDCLEMCRHQKGTPNHKKDFGEFCRYAHLQAEEMINYFLNIYCNKNINKIHNFIVKYNADYITSKSPKHIHHINYASKLFALKSAINLESNVISLLLFLNDYRNELSHRNSLTKINEDKDLQAFENAGFNPTYVDFSKMEPGFQEIYNKGMKVIRKRKQDYNSVYEILDALKNNVLKALKVRKNDLAHNDTIGSANPILTDLKNKLIDKNK